MSNENNTPPATREKQTLEHRLKRTAEVMRGCGPECDIDLCHIISVDEAATELVRLKEDNEAWREGMKEELAETFKLIDALDVRKEIESGVASMKAMLAKIAQLKDHATALAEMREDNAVFAQFIRELLGTMPDEISIDKDGDVAEALARAKEPT